MLALYVSRKEELMKCGRCHDNSSRTREWEEENLPLEGGQTITKAIHQMTKVVQQWMAQGQNNRQEPQ